MTKGYAKTKAWRIKYPEKRAVERSAYYKSHERNRSGRDRYTQAEFVLIITKQREGLVMLDRDIARELGRSIKSLHVMRARFTNGYAPLYTRQWISDGEVVK